MSNKKENGWIKFLRIIIYIVAISGFAIGIGLVKSANLSSSFADGTHDARLANGLAIFIPSLTILAANIFWGIIRWFLRGYREQWRAGRIIGKLIGGSIWRSLLIVPLFLVMLFAMTPQIENAIQQNLIAEQSSFVPYDPNATMDRLKYLDEHFDELEKDAVLEELNELTLANVDFDTDASGNLVTARSFFAQNAYASSTNVKTLNKAKLSDSGKFVIFYTDTGDDKISDAGAAKLGQMLDQIISNYKSNLGLDYEYEKIIRDLDPFKQAKVKKVLTANGIDGDILDTAMPVYVINPYKKPSNILASYAGRRFMDASAVILIRLATVFGEETARLYDSTISYPFIHILPANIESDSLAAVTAHELGHHYAGAYNYNTYGKTGSDDDFIDETGPNWMSINVTTDVTKGVINGGHYNRTYLAEGTEYTISNATPDFPGYPPLAFLQNYYEIVPDSKTKILDAIYYGDALKYLYDQAGAETFAKVMTALAEKNLTGDYGGKLTNYILPKGETLGCEDVCTTIYEIRPASTEYIYFSPEEYAQTDISFKSQSLATASLLGKTASGDWAVLKSGETEIKYELPKDYEVVALAVSNPDIESGGHYAVGIVKTELADIVAEEGNYDFELPSGDILTELGNGCYLININKAAEYLTKFMGFGSDLLGILSEHDSSGGFAKVKNEYDKNTAEATAGINEATTTLNPYNISFCANQIAKGQNFDTVRAKLQAAMGQNINVYNESDKNTRVSVFVGFDIFSRSAKAYALVQDGSDMGLITINIDPK